MIRQQDGPNTLFYLDPPYPPETRSSRAVYAHEADWQHHLELLAMLADLKEKFLISGYRNKHYDRWAAKCSWKRHDFELPNKAARGATKRRMVESVWCNF